MTKAKLIIINSAESKEVVKQLAAALKGVKEDGTKVKVTGLGTFEIKHRAERQGRNPKTGEVITIKAHSKLAFRPSKTLKEEVL